MKTEIQTKKIEKEINGEKFHPVIMYETTPMDEFYIEWRDANNLIPSLPRTHPLAQLSGYFFKRGYDWVCAWNMKKISDKEVIELLEEARVTM